MAKSILSMVKMDEAKLMNVILKLPLEKRTILVTRAEGQKSEAHRLLKAKGARVLDLPALTIGPPDQWNALDTALAQLESFNWLIFSSSNGVVAVEKRLQLLGQSLATKPQGLKIAAVGRKTALTLKSYGADIDFVPPEFVAESLLEHFPLEANDVRLLLPRVQTGGRALLSDSFRESGVEVIEVPAYESCCPKGMPEETAIALIEGEVDAITFTSGKTVQNTVQLLKDRFGIGWEEIIDDIKFISIGPQTSLCCTKYLSRIDEEADPHDLEGLVAACVQCFNTEKDLSDL